MRVRIASEMLRFVSRCRTPRPRASTSSHPVRHQAVPRSNSRHADRLWSRDDQWGLSEDLSEDADAYYQYDFSSSGYELVATALTVAAVAALLKVLWYLALVCYTLVATALQYSIVAITLIIVVVILG